LSMADEALYYGKQNGRNRTTIWSKEISGAKGGKH